MQWMVLLWLTIGIHPSFIFGCSPRYREELRYLDHYLGIEPENEGNLPVAGNAVNRYITNSSELNCRFNEPCAWMNVPDDDLLDTSDFYLFTKTNAKSFPVQIQPGAPDPPTGTKFVLAGNTTSKPQSAVIVSAPVACQRSLGLLTFKYWLYNEAKIETLILRPSTRRHHLQVILRPLTECHFLRALYDYCRVEIPEIMEPFRIGIRAHGLKDTALGSFGMITDVEYSADICLETKISTVFGARVIPPSLASPHPISASEFSCPDYHARCRWSSSLSSLAEWKIGTRRDRWKEIFATDSKPNGSFFYQYVDSVTERPFSLLRSDLIPCTSTVTTLSFRYWLRPGTQVQVCTITATNVIISCIYLNEFSMPGLITIDVDAPSEEPFRFAFEVINFDNSTGGLVAIDDLQFNGLLCNEVTVPPSTTINPLKIKQLFALQAYPQTAVDKMPTLDCNYELDACPQWENDGNWLLGMAPVDNQLTFSPSIREQVLATLLERSSTAVLQSRKVPCARNAAIAVSYFRTEKAALLICIEKRCVTTQTARSVAKSTGPGLVLIRKIETSGKWCPLPTLSQYACEKLSCTFHGTFCGYKTEKNSPNANVMFRSDRKGLTATMNKGPGLAVLRSPQFQLARPLELQIEVYQSTFGSQTFLCGDDFTNFFDCQPILGPKIALPKAAKVGLRIDQDAQNFTIVAVHDKFAQFGGATFVISKIEILDEDGRPLC